MKKFILIAFVIPIIFTLFSVKANAAVIEKKYDRTYEAQDDSVQVTESKAISINEPSWYIPAGTEESFVIFNPIEGDPNQSDKLQKTLNSIKITDSKGLTLSYSSETTSGKNLLIKIRFPNSIVYGSTYTITLSYTSYGLLIKSGAIRDLYIPAFEKNYVFENNNSKETVTTVAKVPKSFGEINFTAPDVSVNVNGNFWTMSYPQNALIGTTGWIQIGKTQYYSFDIKQPYAPSTSIPFPFNTYKVIIPRDIQSGHISQKVYFTKINPEPQSVYEDKDGNLIAEFRVPSVESGIIEVSGYGILNDSLTFDPAKSLNLSDVDKSKFSTELAPAQYWESGSIEIQQAARDIKGTETNVYKLMQKAYQFVVDKIDYSDVKRFGINERQGALETLRNGAGVCMEYSDLFIALMRAMGVPARGAFGHGYSAIDYLSTQDNTINHQWAEVYVPGINSWIPVDTTWGENGPALIGGDLNHFYSHVATIDPDTPSTTEVTFYGSLKVPESVADIEPVDISFTQNKTNVTPEDLVKKYPKVNTPGQFIVDLTSSINLFLHNTNQRINAALINVVPSDSLRSILSGVIMLIPLILLISLIVLKIWLKKKKHKKASELFDRVVTSKSSLNTTHY